MIFILILFLFFVLYLLIKLDNNMHFKMSKFKFYFYSIYIYLFCYFFLYFVRYLSFFRSKNRINLSDFYNKLIGFGFIFLIVMSIFNNYRLINN